MKASARIFKRRKIAHCKRVLCRAIYNYLCDRKLKEKSGNVIRSNIRILFRNYLFREMSAGCRLGAKLLIQREWALRSSDIELRILRIETYLNASTAELPTPYKIHHKPAVPLPKYDLFVSENSWDNIAEFSKEELLDCNVHVLNLRQMDEEEGVFDTPTITHSLDVFESSCMISDVESSARMRLYDTGKKLPLVEAAPPNNYYQKGRRLSSSKQSKIRRATALLLNNPNNIVSSSSNNQGKRGSVDVGQQPKRPGRRHSKTVGGGAGEVSVESKQPTISAASTSSRTDPDVHIGITTKEFDFEGSSLLSQLDYIKKSL
jgi:hypothetical protein